MKPEKRYKIDLTRLKQVLSWEVYDRNSYFLDRMKHFAGTGHTVCGFLLKGARRLRKPLVMKGKLGFFNVECVWIAI